MTQSSTKNPFVIECSLRPIGPESKGAGRGNRAR
jgi:hypothetical protein